MNFLCEVLCENVSSLALIEGFPTIILFAFCALPFKTSLLFFWVIPL